MTPGKTSRAAFSRPFAIMLSAAVATILAAGCSSTGSSNIPVTQSPGVVTPAAQSPNSAPQSSTGTAQSTTRASAITASGTVNGTSSGGFLLQTGPPHGFIDVHTSSATAYVGPKPGVGSKVSVSGSGSWSTSIAASSVTSGAVKAVGTAAPLTTPVPASGSVVWQAGDGTLGRWTDATTYQCGSPVQSGSQFSFVLKQSGTSCGRNQVQPLAANGTLSTLAQGGTYTWKFNYVDGSPDGAGPGMGGDTEAQSLIWQIHGTGQTGTPCTELAFGNAESGAQVWELTTCAHGLGSPYWTGSYKAGERDTWQVTALVSDSSNGYVKLYRNGVLVADAPGANYAGVAPWWNFGPYKWRWELSGGGGSDMKTVGATISGMVLTKP
jgi:hypothetical protein